MDMYAGAILRERAWRWTEWKFWLPSTAPPTPVSTRGINRLRELAFIERDGVLPPGRLEHWYEFHWRVTPAGKAWIEANTKGEKNAR
jgi:hypothetical protein